MGSRNKFLTIRTEIETFITTYKGINLEGDTLAEFDHLTIDEWIYLASHTYHSEGWARNKYNVQLENFN